ncbi:ABC transporter ATP-binding protein [Rhizobium pusense]|uniref:ABC transporter ATP-binding protein n=1 Tax=Agrobacterium pusense TaxID=648995 RepID=UPI000D1B1A0B|nr:ABC transporter ATP-binding protein [Agrobacterium pusense]MDH0911152.1 ABC transporter ATP-binding protein [Agrobacterium pusense]MDH1097221.1 ABC transporter ATP-binding protein [Agrobacterium pusense]MDH1113695.1 ABC transporter ATP-binding protein [Agrobacterium pusense]MDH2193217.1 ABC transporter ATP-binding protein [Agrobacterium pusense]
MAGLNIQSVAKRFGETHVLKRIDLDIRDGEFISLVGPSGCGKSTLLRIVAGLEQQTEGHILLDGRQVDTMRPRDRDLAMVFQSYALYPHLTVAENIAVPLTMRQMSTLERSVLGRLLPSARTKQTNIAGEVGKVCDALSINALKDRKPAALSGGQRQRVALARAMVRKPSAFLMDEPLSNLDAKMRVQARGEIAALHRQLGSTFIYVTHDQAEAMTMSDRIAVMMGGELLQVDTPDQVYQMPQDLRVAEFIGSPKINVAAALRKEGGLLSLVAHGSADAIHAAFRPEAARLTGENDGVMAGTVYHVENLGSDFFVQVKADGIDDLVVVRADPSGCRPAVADRVGIAVDEARLHVFGADNRRIAGVFKLEARR